MINDQTVLAIIPARGGSKRLLRKNILKLAGKPLIAWSIEAAQGSKYINKCIVSTDDKEIAEVAKKNGCEVPFIRPPELATDDASSNDVIEHAINNLEEQYDIVMILQPTSPLRKAEDIDHALEFMRENNVPTVVSVCKANKPLNWHFIVKVDGTLKPILQNKIISNRQECESTYIPNGALYIAKTDYFTSKKTFYTDSTLAYIMPHERSVDIDNRMDFFTAEAIIG